MSGREWSRAHVNGHRDRKIGVLLNRCFSYEGRVTRGVSSLLGLVAASCHRSSRAAVSSLDEGGRGVQANSRRRTAAAAPSFCTHPPFFPLAHGGGRLRTSPRDVLVTSRPGDVSRRAPWVY